MRFVKPIDAALVRELAETHDYLVTVEEGCVMGGAPACVEALMESGVIRPVLQLGLLTCSSITATPRSCCRNAVSTARVSRNRFANAF